MVEEQKTEPTYGPPHKRITKEEVYVVYAWGLTSKHDNKPVFVNRKRLKNEFVPI